jgi:hypothetical protein
MSTYFFIHLKIRNAAQKGTTDAALSYLVAPRATLWGKMVAP